MRLSIILLLLLMSACTKPVYTEYFETENYTEFTTEPFLIKVVGDHVLKLKFTRRCDGKVICQDSKLKLEITQESRFAFLKEKDFLIEADGQTFDLNHRRYFFGYDISKKNNEGTTGIAKERWVVWLEEAKFAKIAKAHKAWILIGEYRRPLSHENREPWRILIDRGKLLATMEVEDQRSYDQYPIAPASETEAREKFEKKARTEAEETTWKLIKDSDNPEDVRFFLEQFPDSPYTPPARLKLKQLERKTE